MDTYYALVTLLVLFIVLQLADIWTTYQCITTAKGKEANPVMRWVIEHLGLLEGLVLLKIVGVVIVVAWLSQMFWALVLLNCFYAYIVWNNWKILKK